MTVAVSHRCDDFVGVNDFICEEREMRERIVQMRKRDARENSK